MKNKIKKLIDKYKDKIVSNEIYKDSFITEVNKDDKKIINFQKTFANTIDVDSIVGYYDTSIFSKGGSGFVFTLNKLYFHEALSKNIKIWYEDIKDFEIENNDKKKDFDKKLTITDINGEKYEIYSSFINKKFFVELLNEIKNEYCGNKEKNIKIHYNSTLNKGSIAAGLAYNDYKNVNKLYDEYKFSAQQGHGFAAERANNFIDKMQGKKAEIKGDDNRPNGPDRIVDGIEIQSKYCQTGKACIDACFDDDGMFRYKNMQIEVPSDKYDEAIKALQEKIKNNKVEGVSDPNKAEDIVRKGHFTYEQAKNIAKAWNVESLKYDAANGMVYATSSFGVTAVISFATTLWQGEDVDVAFKVATYSGLKVGGTAFVTTIMASQLAKAGLNSALVGSSEAIIAFIGPKASAVLINAFRSGANIYGAVAMKSAAKLLRGNIITAGVTVVVLSTFDVVNILRGRISKEQLLKNLANTASTVGGGIGGGMAGAALGSPIPVVGNVVGGVVGAFVGGALAGKASEELLKFIENDSDKMLKIIEEEFSKLAIDYLLNKKEIEKCVDRLQDILQPKILQDMYASKDKEKFAKDILMPLIEKQITKRQKIDELDENDISNCLKDVLIDISSEIEKEA